MKPPKLWLNVLSLVAIGFLFVNPSTTRAQDKNPTYEFGIHYSALYVTEKSDKDSGVGVRFTYNLNDYVGLEAETTDFQQVREGGSSNERQGLFGVRAGKRNKHFGVFAKVRPGITRFYLLGTSPGPNVFEQGHSRFAVDVGGVFEYYLHRHAAIRVDVGDTMVRFKTGDFFYQRLDEPMFVQRRLSHNFQLNVGFALRF
jgi:outer membrane protein with beta-barrel domain